VIVKVIMAIMVIYAHQTNKCSPVIEEAPNHSARAIENIGHNGHPSKKMVIIDEGEAKGLGEVCNDALGELDSQEANPYL
jgi:hypothetical protein